MKLTSMVGVLLVGAPLVLGAQQSKAPPRR